MSLGTEIALIKALGGGSSLPSVTSADAGKVLGVNDSGVWGAQNPKFVVTLTPTSLDYSGTMDKTVAEIDNAYKAGRKIVFRVQTGATNENEVDSASRYYETAYDYPSYSGYLIDDENGVLIYAYTGVTNDGTKATYGTHIYALTPAT